MRIKTLSSYSSLISTKKRFSQRFPRPLSTRRVFCLCTKSTGSAVWKESLSFIVEIGFETTEADSLLSEAFGWGSQKYWHKKKVNENPDPNIVKENLTYLQSMGFEKESLIDLIKGFPEVLACDLDTRIRPNMEYLEKSFYLKGKHRIKAILRKPRILGNIIDCEGDCKGECSRCWSQF